MVKVFNRPVKLAGHEKTVNDVDVQVLEYDGDTNILLCTGTTVPTADSTGFAKGCLFIKTDAADGTKGLYENQGTSSASDFNLIGSVSASEINAGLGTSGTPLEHTAHGDEVYSVHVTTSSTSGASSYEPVSFNIELTGAGQVGGRVLFYTKTDVVLGGWANAAKAHMDFQDNGAVTGLGSAFVAEMTMPGSTPSGGNYGVYEAELNCPASFDAGSIVALSFLHLSAQGATVGEFDDHGFLMNVQGVSAGDGHLLQTGDTLATVAGSLRIKVGSTTYYLPLYDGQVTTAG